MSKAPKEWVGTLTIIIAIVFGAFPVAAQLDFFPPVAKDDAASTFKNTPVTLNVIANDRDLDYLGSIDPKTVDLDVTKNGIQKKKDIPEGKFDVNNDGVVKFDPANDFLGTASINYTVKDLAGKTSNQATITITVMSAPNVAPVAANDAATTMEGQAVTVNVIANDSDSDGSLDGASVDLNTSQGGIQNSATTPQGNFSVNTSGVLTYSPAANFSGTASLAYTVKDNEGLSSNAATVTITVTSAPNVAPIAANDAASTNENTAVTINVVANDTDSDGTINKGSVDLNTSQGGIQNSATTPQGNFSVNTSGVLTYSPAANFSGTASLAYTVKDNEGLSSNAATVTITVNPAPNVAPIAANDATSTNENTAVNINVIANDTDSDGTINKGSVDLNTSQNGIQNSASTTQGTYSVNGNGVVTYTPVPNYSGTATINYVVSDNEGAKSNVASISVTVNSVNAAPAGVPDSIETESNRAASVNVVSNDTDADGTLEPGSVDLDPVTTGDQKRIDLPEGVLEVTPAALVTYTPAENYFGTFSTSYTVKDNEGAVSNETTITINVREVTSIAIDIPTGFTPNGDGANETWTIRSRTGALIDVPLAEVKVFDRRGALVYDALGFENPWDGKYNGKPLPADSYYYIIDLKQDGMTYHGIVTILTSSP